MPKDIVEQIMTQHWDMKSCDCWVCVDGRKAGLRPRETHLKNKQPEVRVEYSQTTCSCADETEQCIHCQERKHGV